MQNFQKFDQYFVDPQRPEQGLTATSASFLAGLASQECKRLKKIVEGATFYDIHLQIMLDDKSRLMHKGKDATYLEGLPEVVRRIGELTAFIAYTHEAIKEKERRTEYVDGLMFEDWLELPENKEKKTFSEEKIEKPVAPQKADAVDTDWAKARLSVKELTEYLMNEAHAATIGEFVHPKGALANAKDALAEKIVNPIQANEDGTETTIKAFVPSVDPDLFYRSYNRFQAYQRGFEAKVNAAKAKFEAIAKDENLRQNKAYREALADYTQKLADYDAKVRAHNTQMKVFETEYANWVIKEHEAIRKLKIIIPNDLQGIYDYLSSIAQG